VDHHFMALLVMGLVSLSNTPFKLEPKQIFEPGIL